MLETLRHITVMLEALKISGPEAKATKIEMSTERPIRKLRPFNCDLCVS